MVATRSTTASEAGPSVPKPHRAASPAFVQLPASESEEAEEDERSDEGEDDDANTDEGDADSDSDDNEGANDPADESDSSVTSEQLNELLARARAKYASKAAEKAALQEEVITLSDDRPLPPLDPGPSLPKPYFTTPGSKQEARKLAIDPGLERLNAAAGKRKAVDAVPEAEAGGRLAKKQRREMREKTAGPEWFDMPSPSGAELAKIKREMEAARLAAALDPKTFLRKEALRAEVPRYVQLGTIVSTRSPFNSGVSGKNLSRAERKRSIVDELVEDAEAKAYAKRKFLELQNVRGERGKLTLRRRKEMKAARRKF